MFSLVWRREISDDVKIMRLSRFAGALVAMSCIGVCSCSNANGASNSSTSPPQMQICDQACRDDTTAYGLDNAMWLLWNENIAGQTAGTQSKTIQCPLAGTADISGTTAVASNGINTVHLSLVLTGCGSSSPAYSLAFSGTVAWDGTFGSSVSNAVTFKSSELDVSGTIRLDDMPTVTETCAIALTDTYDKDSGVQSGWLNGTVCGRAAAQ